MQVTKFSDEFRGYSEQALQEIRDFPESWDQTQFHNYETGKHTHCWAGHVELVMGGVKLFSPHLILPVRDESGLSEEEWYVFTSPLNTLQDLEFLHNAHVVGVVDESEYMKLKEKRDRNVTN